MTRKAGSMALRRAMRKWWRINRAALERARRKGAPWPHGAARESDPLLQRRPTPHSTPPNSKTGPPGPPPPTGYCHRDIFGCEPEMFACFLCD